MRTVIHYLVAAGLSAVLSFAQPSEDFPILSWTAPRYFQPFTSGEDRKDTAKAAASGRLEFIAVTPCRVLDTRNANGAFGGPALSAGQIRTIPIPGSSCGIPNSAQAYSLNFTVVASGVVGYLSAWPTANRPVPDVSLLNVTSPAGGIIANAAVVPAGTSASIDIFATHPTHVIIDINGYFAPQFPRTAGGYVNSSGAATGMGFTAVRNGPGNYQVSYDTPFLDNPNVSVTLQNTGGIVAVVTSVLSSPTTLKIHVKNAAGQFVDSGFWFNSFERF